MAVEIVMPQAGESVTSGVIGRWLKAPGDAVARDEAVVEVETDKVNLEVPAPSAGVLGAHLVKAGETVAIGQVLGSIDPAGTPAAKAPVAAPSQASAPVAAVNANGKTASTATAVVEATADVRATPLAKKLADEHGVDLSGISGSGAGGRVREQDVLAFVQTRATAPSAAKVGVAQVGVVEAGVVQAGAAQASAPAAVTAARVSDAGVTRERMTPLRQRIAQRLVQAQHTAAMLTTFNEVDMGAVMDLRKLHKEEFEKKHGVGLGFMGFFVKAVVQGLRAFPLVNASIVEEDGSLAIEKHAHAHIAVAVSTPKGLVVPVLRRCEELSIAGIEKGIKDLATKARDGKLGLEEMQGGTFTITNGGVFGSLMSTPILNPPQSGILGMHTIKNRAVEYPVGSGQVGIRPMMYLALSYDHRIIDGAEAVQFLVKVKQAIEDPHRLLLAL